MARTRAGRPEQFRIEVPDDVLNDLYRRLVATRWPEPAPGEPWGQGADRAWLHGLVDYWADRFDWRAQERWLNGFTHVRVVVDGLRLHAARVRAGSGERFPLLLANGWPSSFVELLPLADMLARPEAHGLDAPAFDVVIPSLPGYAFSDRPRTGGVTMRNTAALWHELMRSLGHERYGCHGGDFGAGVTTFLALDRPESVAGLHLSSLEIRPSLGPNAPPLSDAERSYLRDVERWEEGEAGYRVVQSTRPQTIGYALEDSAVGLAAWLLEKWRAWSDCDGDLDSTIPRDLLLTNVMIYWVTRTATSAARYYHDQRWLQAPLDPDEVVNVPTGVAVYANHLVPEGTPPRAWAERLYRVVRWTEMPAGGHFPAVEDSRRLAADIAAFFADAAS